MERQSIDIATIRRAEEIAAERHPLPKETPATAVAKTVMFGIMIAALFETLDRWLPRWAAELGTLGLCALVVFLDYRQKWNSHSRAVKEAFERLRGH